MKFFCFAGSLRQGSLNQLVLKQTQKELNQLGFDCIAPDFKEFDLPHYNGDLDLGNTYPENLLKFKNLMESTDASIIVCPEYNHSIPGLVKNLVDWVSRLRPTPWKNRNILLMSASPSMSGGRMGLWQLRIPLTACGAYVFPDMFCLPKAHEAFADGHLKDPKTLEILRGTLKNFVDYLKT